MTEHSRRQVNSNYISYGEAMASQITNLTIVYSNVCSGADQIKHQSSVSLAFVTGIHRSPANSPHKGPVTRKMFPFDDVIMMVFTSLSLNVPVSASQGSPVAMNIQFELRAELLSAAGYSSKPLSASIRVDPTAGYSYAKDSTIFDGIKCIRHLVLTF